MRWASLQMDDMTFICKEPAEAGVGLGQKRGMIVDGIVSKL